MKLAILVIAFAFIVICSQLDADARRSRNRCLKAKLQRVIDGDTITVKFLSGRWRRKRITRIRMTFIDAPETAQKYGKKSTKMLKKLLKKNKKFCIKSKGRDRYGRILGVVFYRNRDINKKMVVQGHAWCYRGRCPASYKRAQKKAKKNKKGLWKLQKKPVAPWIWRKKNKKRSKRKRKLNPKCKAAKLIRVIDGDTIIVKLKSKRRRGQSSNEKIQMKEIDTPETRQAYGPEATRHLRTLLGNGRKFCVKSFGRGYFQRILGVVYLKKVDINLKMIKDGYAWCYRGKCKRSYKNAMRKAKRMKKGLWSSSSPVAPWVWRKRNKKSHRRSN